jgi:hypothetical protein
LRERIASPNETPVEFLGALDEGFKVRRRHFERKHI